MLSEKWVNELFARLLGVYGRDFSHKFSRVVKGEDVGLADAKQAWAIELAFCSDHPESIKWALANLPDKAPNAIEFKRLCKAAPRQEKPSEADSNALPCEISEEQRQKNIEQIRAMVNGFVRKTI